MNSPFSSWDLNNPEVVKDLRPTVASVARKVAGAYKFSWSYWHDDDNTAHTSSRAVTADELENAAWEHLYRYKPSDFEYLYSTLHSDLHNEADRLMRQTSWTDDDAEGRWQQKVTTPGEAWLFGGRIPGIGEPKPSGELLAKLAEEYPTLVAWAERGTDEATATALGVARTTVLRRRGREMSRLQADTALVESLAWRCTFRSAPKRYSGPAYAAGPGRPRAEAYAGQATPNLTTRTYEAATVTTLDVKYADMASTFGTPLADLANGRRVNRARVILDQWRAGLKAA